MEDKFGNLIRRVYNNWKSAFSEEKERHPDEEDFACFLEGKLSEEESVSMMRHLIRCSRCSDIVAAFAKLSPAESAVLPNGLLVWARKGAYSQDKSPALEIVLRLKQELLEIINTSGDILLGQELVPAPVLRSRGVKDFKDEVVILKDFKNVMAQIKIRNRDGKTFDLDIIAKEKQTNRIIRGLTFTLKKDNIEMESYLADSGSAVFECILPGGYLLEAATAGRKLVVITLDIKI